MRTRRLILAMAASSLFVAAASAVADDESWKGEYVVTTKPGNDIKFSDAVDEKQQILFKAVRRQTQAIKLQQSQGKETDNYRQRLKLYEGKQPYRQ